MIVTVIGYVTGHMEPTTLKLAPFYQALWQAGGGRSCVYEPEEDGRCSLCWSEVPWKPPLWKVFHKLSCVLSTKPQYKGKGAQFCRLTLKGLAAPVSPPWW